MELRMSMSESKASSALFSEVRCDFCNSDNTEPVQLLHDIWLHKPGEFHLVRCKDCGLEYLNPRPGWELLQQHYSNDYYSFMGAIKKRTFRITEVIQNHGLRRRAKFILKKKKAGKLLDVGCATGSFLYEMQKNPGWQVSGVELVEIAAQAARERYGIDVFTGSLFDAGFADNSWDVVTLFDVLEHTSNPSLHLKEVIRILKPGGWFIIKVPHPVSYQARLFGPAWVGYEAPHHLFGFPPSTLTNKLREMGFVKVEINHLGSDYFAWWMSLGGWLEMNSHPSLGALCKRISTRAVLRAISYPVFAFVSLLGLHASKVYAAQKPESAN